MVCVKYGGAEGGRMKAKGDIHMKSYKLHFTRKAHRYDKPEQQAAGVVEFTADEIYTADRAERIRELILQNNVNHIEPYQIELVEVTK